MLSLSLTLDVLLPVRTPLVQLKGNLVADLFSDLGSGSSDLRLDERYDQLGIVVDLGLLAVLGRGRGPPVVPDELVKVLGDEDVDLLGRLVVNRHGQESLLFTHELSGLCK